MFQSLYYDHAHFTTWCPSLSQLNFNIHFARSKDFNAVMQYQICLNVCISYFRQHDYFLNLATTFESNVLVSLLPDKREPRCI